MNIVRREGSPLSAYRPGLTDDPLGRLVENMFDDFFAPFTPYSSLLSRRDGDAVVSPRLNVTETDHTFEVEAELPGVAKEDVQVAIDGRRITIEGQAKHEAQQKEGERVVYSERSTSRFARSFMLTVEVDDSKAQAKLENGILLLSLPKKVASQAKRLTVQ
jgi:HSP20 family protein